MSRKLLDQVIERGEMDLATEFSVPLPMMVIADMIGVPAAEQQLKRWSEVILGLSYDLVGGEAAQALREFQAVTAEMSAYLAGMIAEREAQPKDDLLTRLVAAEVDGERLTQEDILWFFQLLLVGGQETTTNLIDNAILSFLENPDQLARITERMDLLPSAIEEVLRFRSRFQFTPRITRRDVEMRGQTIKAGKRVLAMIGSANRDPQQFSEPHRFDIMRDPNPHIAFGHGIHFCLGATLSRLEARIAIADILERLKSFELASNEPWEPRKALHVHGPNRLPIQFQPGRRAAAPA